MVDPTTGELIERRLEHENCEAEKFYGALPGPARVGIEATISAQSFERLLHRYGHELWVGDAAEIRAARVRKQKTDSRDALHILDLLLTKRFPHIRIPSPAERNAFKGASLGRTLQWIRRTKLRFVYNPSVS